MDTYLTKDQTNFIHRSAFPLIGFIVIFIIVIQMNILCVPSVGYAPTPFIQ